MNSSKQTDILYVGSYTEIVAGDFGGYGEGISCFEFDANEVRHELQKTHPSSTRRCTNNAHALRAELLDVSPNPTPAR